MIPESELMRMEFELNEANPICLIHNIHTHTEDHWFDMHYPFELGILLKGRMRRDYLNYETELGPGDVWFCGMWEPHGFDLLETPVEVVVVVIDPEFLFNNPFRRPSLLSPFQAPSELRPHVPEERRQEVQVIGERLLAAHTEQTESAWYELLFYELMLIVEECWTAPAASLGQLRATLNIQEALKMVYEQKRLITTEEAASVCNLSVNKFRILFKELMGTTFADFALHYRIRGAMSTLKNSVDTQEVIAQQWGFTDASHLYKCIKASKSISN